MTTTEQGHAHPTPEDSPMLTKTRGQTSKLGYFVKSNAYSNIIVSVAGNSLWIEQGTEMISMPVWVMPIWVADVLARAVDARANNVPFGETQKVVRGIDLSVNGYDDGCITISQDSDTVMLSCEDAPVLVEAIRRTIAA